MTTTTHPPAPAGIAERLQALLPGRATSAGAAQDPSAPMFARIGRRLTLWYLAVLAGILILAGAALYFGVRQALLTSINDDLTTSAQQMAEVWQRDPDRICRHLPPSQRVPYIACFNTEGDIALAANPVQPVPRAFISDGLIHRVMAGDRTDAFDIIDGGDGLGAIERYALVVRTPGDNSLLGVVQVGVPIAGQLRALDVLLVLLLVLGALTLGAAALGALFLSSRALAPARLAFARQQAFIADASHELRTPLTLMRADAEVLLRGRDRLAPDDTALLEDIVVETAHMATLAGNMLTLARLDAGTQPIEHDLVDLADVATGAVHRAQTLAAERSITLAIESPCPAPVLVLGDRALLDQAAMILLDNAIKYNHPGGSVTLRAFTAGHDAVLQVRDTGEGIPPEHLAHLGERFYRVDKARSREQGGAGLGLSIARGIASSHSGTLSIQSAPSAGTTAALILPAAEA